jgi:hypothetical protein
VRSQDLRLWVMAGLLAMRPLRPLVDSRDETVSLPYSTWCVYTYEAFTFMPLEIYLLIQMDAFLKNKCVFPRPPPAGDGWLTCDAAASTTRGFSWRASQSAVFYMVHTHIGDI